MIPEWVIAVFFVGFTVWVGLQVAAIIYVARNPDKDPRKSIDSSD